MEGQGLGTRCEGRRGAAGTVRGPEEEEGEGEGRLRTPPPAPWPALFSPATRSLPQAGDGTSGTFWPVECQLVL